MEKWFESEKRTMERDAIETGNKPIPQRIHLQDYRFIDGTAVCGDFQVKTMSHHELKRNRITCPPCIRVYFRRR